jgi:hypothetical protein
MGIGGELLGWIKNYLSNRYQQVVVNGQTSKATKIKAGVPQGSILGPLFFIVYMNDLTENTDVEVRMYADDVTLYIDYKSIENVKETMERNLNEVTRWAKRWYMKFNPSKTEELHFSRKRQHFPIDLVFDNKVIEIVNSHKHLGVTLQMNGRWTEHIDQTTRRANKRLDIIRSFNKSMDRRSMEKLYISYVRPILEYGGTVWCNINKGEQDQLEEIQLNAIRIVTGTKKGTSHRELREEMGWPSLKERRTFQCLSQLYKIIHRMAPDSLSDILPMAIDQRNPYGIRSSQNLDIPRAKSEAYANSYFPQVCRLWNELPKESKNSTSLEEFKEKTKPNYQPPPQHYYLGTRKQQILMSRLRVKNIDLNANLYQRNLKDTDQCDCNNGAETIEHFLLECTSYNVQRRKLFYHLRNINLLLTAETLIKGNENLSATDNNKIIMATIEYINETARFS